ncbi:MAG: hypothetical protein F7C35_03710 [Desulfurococcales archaeon]|nr:hypothetical protein [Desulfurococcales archaeon]
MTMTKYTRLALEIFQHAAKRGVPVYAEARRPYYLVIHTSAGNSVYRIVLLEDIDTSGDHYLAVKFSTGYGEVVLGRIRGEELVERYPWMVPKAVALNILMMSNYESDVWSKRVLWYEGGEMNPIIDAGEWVVYKHSEWDCYAVSHRKLDITPAWYNRVLDRVDCSAGWLEKWFPDVERGKIWEGCEVLRSVGVRD